MTRKSIVHAALSRQLRRATQVDAAAGAGRKGRAGAQPPRRCLAVTEAGRDALRRALAMDALFGQPWPTVAEVAAQEQSYAF